MHMGRVDACPLKIPLAFASVGISLNDFTSSATEHASRSILIVPIKMRESVPSEGTLFNVYCP